MPNSSKSKDQSKLSQQNKIESEGLKRKVAIVLEQIAILREDIQKNRKIVGLVTIPLILLSSIGFYNDIKSFVSDFMNSDEKSKVFISLDNELNHQDNIKFDELNENDFNKDVVLNYQGKEKFEYTLLLTLKRIIPKLAETAWLSIEDGDFFEVPLSFGVSISYSNTTTDTTLPRFFKIKLISKDGQQTNPIQLDLSFMKLKLKYEIEEFERHEQERTNTKVDEVITRIKEDSSYGLRCDSLSKYIKCKTRSRVLDTAKILRIGSTEQNLEYFVDFSSSKNSPEIIVSGRNITINKKLAELYYQIEFLNGNISEVYKSKL